MKKTLILLGALAGLSSALATEYVWDFNDDGTSTTPTGSSAITLNAAKGEGVTTDVTYLATQYGMVSNFTDGTYLTANALPDLTGALTMGTGGSSFTLMAYLNTGSLSSNTTGEYFFFGTGDSNAAGLGFGIKDGKLDLLAKTHKHNVAEGNNAKTLTSNTWYHVAVTYSSSDNAIKFYLNGKDAGSTTAGNDFTALGTDAVKSIYIGAASKNSAQDDFNGSIAQFQIVTGTALTAEQISAAAIPPTPEPTTATLSLLALAGLAARRRRR